MNNILKKLIDIQKIIEQIFTFFCIIAATILLLLLSGNVFVRIFPIISLHWFGEIVELVFAWLVFIGASVLFSQKDHFMIDWLEKKTKGKKVEPFYISTINIICLMFVITLLVQGFRLTKIAVDWTAVLHLPRRMFYCCMPVSAAFMVYAGLLDIIKSIYNSKKRQERE